MFEKELKSKIGKEFEHGNSFYVLVDVCSVLDCQGSLVKFVVYKSLDGKNKKFVREIEHFIDSFKLVSRKLKWK